MNALLLPAAAGKIFDTNLSNGNCLARNMRIATRPNA